MIRSHVIWKKTVFLAVAASMLFACTTETVRNPVPLEYQHDAEVVEMPSVRAWGDKPSESFHKDVVASIKNEKAGLFPRGPDGAFQYAGLAVDNRFGQGSTSSSQ